jgi:hypothetical protein
MPPILRRAAFAILPIAVALIVYLEILLGKAHKNSISGTGIHIAQAVVLVLALLLSSPLITRVVKGAVKAILLLAATGWVAFSVIIAGGRHHWWPSLVKPKKHILLENLAFLTCMIAVLIIVILIFSALRGKYPRVLSSPVPSAPPASPHSVGSSPGMKTVYNPNPDAPPGDFRVIPDNQSVDPGGW